MHPTMVQTCHPLAHLHVQAQMIADSKRRSLYELCRELGNGKENCKAVLEWVEGATSSRFSAANALKVLKGIGHWTPTQESIIDSKIIEMDRWACQSNRIRE